MKTTCPHCTQPISIEAEVIASLAGGGGFACPACGGHVPLSDLPVDDSESPPKSLDESGADDWTAPDPADLARSFDARYRIHRLVGRGGMGAVYEGFDTRLDRRVAIKIIPVDAAANPDAITRFEREAKAMAALDHPHILHIYDFGSTADGHPFLIMEFIDGTDVHRLRQTGQLDLPVALEIISQVCSALAYAHARGIVHRDIKPANILITREGMVKVADFGLAKILTTDSRSPHDPTLTRSGASMGSPAYMAPEQFAGEKVDHRADIFSLGVMLYELLTGAPPWGAWPPPSQSVRIDVRLDEIVLRALQQNPAARYQAAAEVREDIDSVKFSTGGGPLPPGARPEPLPSNRRNAPPASTAARSATPPPPAVSQPLSSQRGKNPKTICSLARKMLVLGLPAIAIIAALAIYRGNRNQAGEALREEFVLIPAGSFQMGNQSALVKGSDHEYPVHTVQLSAFYMAKYETTKELWDKVREWGLTHGYTDLAFGNDRETPKGANHPVHSISWYDIVKWCNARSEKENLVPCYTVSGATYKTGNIAPSCNWNANGYRLPTEAEWEKAARGGVSGKNFPFGDTVIHSQANYRSSSSRAYDLSGAINNFHPAYANGDYPYSSPVGSFAPNGYGLYDMAGNMAEWCWDWYGSYSSGSHLDSRGPASGSRRVVRGGSWDNYADGCRAAYRYSDRPANGDYNAFGFRLVRGRP